MTKRNAVQLEEPKTFIVQYKNDLYDITKFQNLHPGGVNTLSGLNNKTMDARFNSSPHSPAALYLMQEYKIKESDVHDKNLLKSMDEVARNSIDESLEHLVDWNKPMLPQIHKLGDKYSEWVNNPVDRHLRLFGPSILEILTKTPWYAPLVFWVPAILYLIDYGIKTIPTAEYSNISAFCHIVLGIGLWTFVEYSLHRYVFHLNAKNKYLAVFHFLLHGLHHKVPFDPYRLVFPPFPAVLLATLFYQPIQLIFSNPILVLSGGLIGYLTYDMIHFYIHHGSPDGGHLYFMKRYHYAHHFISHDKGFGISSSFWDKVFGTLLYLRKLKYVLKW